MMKGKMMEEKIRIPENRGIIPLLYDFTQMILPKCCLANIRICKSL